MENLRKTVEGREVLKAGLSGLEHLKMILYCRDRVKTFAWERRIGLRLHLCQTRSQRRKLEKGDVS